jgi:hypothetical protein
MNIFSLLPRSFTVEAGGVATGGGHASSGEPELLGEGILGDSRKAFGELLSQGFVHEGEQQSPLGAQGKDLHGELVEDLKALKGSKVLESLEEIFSSEEALGILDVSDSLPFFEGTSLMLLREAALQYLQPSEEGAQGGEEVLPQGQNCKTEEELMALLATLDRKGNTSLEPLSSEQGLLVQEPSASSLPQGQNEKTQQELMALLSGLDRKIVPQGEEQSEKVLLQENAPASESSGEMTEEELLLPVSKIPEEEKISQESLLSGNLPKGTVPGKDLVSQEHAGGKAIQEAPLKKGLKMAGEKNGFPKSGEESLALKTEQTEKSAGGIPLFESSKEKGDFRLLSGTPAEAPEKIPEVLLPEKEPAKQPSLLQEMGERLARGPLVEQAVQSSGMPSSAAERGEPLSNRGAASPESPQAFPSKREEERVPEERVRRILRNFSFHLNRGNRENPSPSEMRGRSPLSNSSLNPVWGGSSPWPPPPSLPVGPRLPSLPEAIHSPSVGFPLWGKA